VNIGYGDKQLERIETDDAISLKLSLAVIKAARRKLVVIRAAPDERTLRNWKSLHYEKLKGSRKGQHSIRLNEQWRMVFSIDVNTNPPTIIVLGFDDYH
jgi:proteic killer suppression protein